MKCTTEVARTLKVQFEEPSTEGFENPLAVAGQCSQGMSPLQVTLKSSVWLLRNMLLTAAIMVICSPPSCQL